MPVDDEIFKCFSFSELSFWWCWLAWGHWKIYLFRFCLSLTLLLLWFFFLRSAICTDDDGKMLESFFFSFKVGKFEFFRSFPSLSSVNDDSRLFFLLDQRELPSNNYWLQSRSLNLTRASEEKFSLFNFLWSIKKKSHRWITQFLRFFFHPPPIQFVVNFSPRFTRPLIKSFTKHRRGERRR